MPFSGGVFRLADEWRLFYLADYQRVCWAVSDDGLSWRKLGVLMESSAMDSFSVAHHAGRWYMTISQRSGGPLRLLESADGVRWADVAVMPWAGDRTTCWWNPFKERWTFNVRNGQGTGGDPRRIDRVESATFIPKAWEPQRWLQADVHDAEDNPEIFDAGLAQLYALDVAPDGNRLVGLFTIWKGQQPGRPKLNDVYLGFSTDGGDTWQRRYTPVLTRSETPGAWNYGNVQSCSGGLVRLSPWHVRLYCSGRSGDGTGGNGTCSMGFKDVIL